MNGNSLTKTAATGWGNAGASSAQSIASGDGYVEVTATETTTARLFGFSHTDADQSWPSIEFGIDLDLSGSVYVFESGNNRGNFGPYAPGDKLQVAIVGGVVKYKKNGVVFYTSSLTPIYPLVVDTALHANGCTLSNVVLSSGATGTAKVQWLVSDHLGTPRLILDQTGSLATLKRHDYLPFGEEISSGTGGRTSAMGYVAGDGVRQQFTKQERDVETGLDYVGARYYSSSQGRFTGVDQGAPELLEPQTWNRYQYARNNPLYFIDADGNKDEPAKNQRVNQALANDPTLLEVIKASNNFSQRAFEDALNKGALRGELNTGAGNILRGAAGEATIIDWLRNGSSPLVVSQPASQFLSAIGVDASIPNSILPDIGAVITTGSLGPIKVQGELSQAVQDSKGNTGHTVLPDGTKFGLYEVKSGFSGSTIAKGAAQVAATAAVLKASGLPGVAVLVADKAAYQKLSTSQRAAIYNTVTKAGGYIQLYNGLAQQAAERAKKVRKEASQ